EGDEAAPGGAAASEAGSAAAEVLVAGRTAASEADGAAFGARPSGSRVRSEAGSAPGPGVGPFPLSSRKSSWVLSAGAGTAESSLSRPSGATPPRAVTGEGPGGSASGGQSEARRQRGKS